MSETGLISESGGVSARSFSKARDLTFRFVSSLGRRWPLNRGHYAWTTNPIVNWSIVEQAWSIPVPLRSGLRISVDLSDYNGRMLGLFGSVEPAVTKICRALLRPGWSFLDIGANYGGVGLNCFDAVGPDGEVHFFEPQRDLCARIQQCIDAAEARGLFVHPVGILDRDGELPLRRPNGHSGAAGFFRREGAGVAETVAPLRSFDGYVRPLVEGRQFGAKLDVEGAEGFILPQVLRSPGFRFAVFECNDLAEAPPLWQALRETGCVLYGVMSSLVRVRLERIELFGDMARFTDFLAVEPGAVAAGPRCVLTLREVASLL
jgi:FkbM family methyltransferase